MWEHCKTGQAECIMTSLMRRPKAPKEWSLNRYEWLSSDDIDAAETKLFVEMVPDYFYVGTVPMDFDLQSETSKCLVSTLCAMKLPELFAKGKHRIGIVINTDPHDGPGQHWVAVFCDIRPELEFPRMTYFDSYAQKPEPEIRTLMKRWKSQWDATRTHTQGMKLTYNKTRHQYKDSECGMYCLYVCLRSRWTRNSRMTSSMPFGTSCFACQRNLPRRNNEGASDCAVGGACGLPPL
jgi:hypothetical protein